MNLRGGMIFGGVISAVAGCLKAAEDSGAAAVEFALFLPFFLLVLAGTVDLGYLTYTASELSAAVSAGSLYAANNGALVATSPDTLSGNIQAIVANANGTGWATSAVNINNGDPTHCYCPTGPLGNWTWGSAMTCGGVCSGGGVAGQFVTITASHTVSPVFPTLGLTYNGTVSRSAIIETQ